MRIKKDRTTGVQLPTKRREPSSDLWEYSYLITGEKKIGKTTFAIESSEELILQFDKPQLAYAVHEVCPTNWLDIEKIIRQLTDLANDGKLPYNRLVVDGVVEMHNLCQLECCKYYGIEHPSEEGFARGWHRIRDKFTKAINDILRLQSIAGCGVVFIAHSEWKETPGKYGRKIEKLTPDLTGLCHKVVAGKVDAWFSYGYFEEHRTLTLLGDETTEAGHRIDGHFLTPEGERIREIPMGLSPKEALEIFKMAFNNQWKFTDLRKYLESLDTTTKKPRLIRRKNG